MFPKQVHTTGDAPQQARSTLEALEAKIGFIPNVFGLYAQSPVALNGLVALNAAFEASSLTPVEREVVSLATSVFNGCPYCVAGHSTFLMTLGIDPTGLERIRSGGVPPDPRLAALCGLTTGFLEARGSIGLDQMQAFLDAGFHAEQAFDVLLGIACKLMTNFAAKAVQLPLDPAFESHAWVPPRAAKTAAA